MGRIFSSFLVVMLLAVNIACGSNENDIESQSSPISYRTIKVQINGRDMGFPGYVVHGDTHIQWGVLNILKLPNKYLGNAKFTIENRTVQGVVINGHSYLQWNQIAPGRLVACSISGGWNFVYDNGNKFLIVISEVLNKNQAVFSAMQTYRDDLKKAGWETEVLIVAPSSNAVTAAANLKNQIIDRYNHGLDGFIIVGSDPAIPTAKWHYHTNDSAQAPSDVYYADVDKWVDINEDGIYENYESKKESNGEWGPDLSKPVNPANPKFYPELFFGRIAMLPISSSEQEEAEKVVNYFEKLHLYRTRGSSLTAEQENRALYVGGDDLSDESVILDFSYAAPNITAFFNRVVTTPDRYANELTKGYRFVQVDKHSFPTESIYSSYRNGLPADKSFTVEQLEKTEVNVNFLNLNGCSGSKFDEKNMAATYLNKKFMLNVAGLTGPWGWILDSDFWKALATGVPIGKAFRDDLVRKKQYDEVGCPKGILMGDPLMTYKKDIPNHASSISTDLRSVVVNPGQSLKLDLHTQDIENNNSTISVSGLPDSASFNGRTLEFTAPPDSDGMSFVLEVTVSEPASDIKYHETFAIEVAPKSSPKQLRNIDFEKIDEEGPVYWNKDAWNFKNEEFLWGEEMGREGSMGISIRSTEKNDSRWLQPVEGLVPGKKYRLTGWIKGENVVSETGDSMAANICLMGGWDRMGMSGTFDWTELSLPFTAPDDGKVVVGCRLGFYSNIAAGQIWCDDLEIVEE